MSGATSVCSGTVAVPVKELRKLLDQAQDVALLVAMAESSVMCLARAQEHCRHRRRSPVQPGLQAAREQGGEP